MMIGSFRYFCAIFTQISVIKFCEDLLLSKDSIELHLNDSSVSFDISDDNKKEKVYNELRRYLIDLTVNRRIDKIKEWFSEQEGELTSRIKKEAI